MARYMRKSEHVPFCPERITPWHQAPILYVAQTGSYGFIGYYWWFYQSFQKENRCKFINCTHLDIVIKFDFSTHLPYESWDLKNRGLEIQKNPAKKRVKPSNPSFFESPMILRVNLLIHNYPMICKILGLFSSPISRKIDHPLLAPNRSPNITT